MLYTYVNFIVFMARGLTLDTPDSLTSFINSITLACTPARYLLALTTSAYNVNASVRSRLQERERERERVSVCVCVCVYLPSKLKLTSWNYFINQFLIYSRRTSIFSLSRERDLCLELQKSYSGTACWFGRIASWSLARTTRQSVCGFDALKLPRCLMFLPYCACASTFPLYF